VAAIIETAKLLRMEAVERAAVEFLVARLDAIGDGAWRAPVHRRDWARSAGKE
jgi:hypothetical protein